MGVDKSRKIQPINRSYSPEGNTSQHSTQEAVVHRVLSRSKHRLSQVSDGLSAIAEILVTDPQNRSVVWSEQLEKKVRELYDVMCRLEEEKYDWEMKLIRQNAEVELSQLYITKQTSLCSISCILRVTIMT